MQIAAYTIPESPRIRVYSAGIEGLIAICSILASHRATEPVGRACLPGASQQPPVGRACLPGAPLRDLCASASASPQSPRPNETNSPIPNLHSCIVCPDSVLGHIAAAYPEIPVISLWSSFSPADRIASYTNHKPIYNAIKCSPCRAHEQTGNPKDYRGCPHTSCNDYCAGLRTIAPDLIVSAVATALCAVPSSPVTTEALP
jgi:hypothetical protein